MELHCIVQSVAPRGAVAGTEGLACVDLVVHVCSGPPARAAEVEANQKHFAEHPGGTLSLPGLSAELYGTIKRGDRVVLALSPRK